MLTSFKKIKLIFLNFKLEIFCIYVTITGLRVITLAKNYTVYENANNKWAEVCV